MQNNYDLLDLNGLSALTTIGGDLTVDANSDLTDVTGLHNVGAVGGDVAITDNTSLSTDDAQTLVDTIGEDNITGGVTIYGNLEE